MSAGLPVYTAEMEYLASRDPVLAELIARVGPLPQPATSDLFTSLAEGIASQQISGKAAASIWRRFRELVGEVTPAAVVGHAPDELRACGLSYRKAEYILGIAGAFLDDTLDPAALPSLPDEQVIARLVALRGVGIWTAEMMLIFSLGRPDVVSWGDLGIRRGMQRLYGYPELTRALFEEHRKVYSPYGSTASLYLWHAGGEGYHPEGG
ncbi:MAG: DNA-3-methyladenine glycosylase family protein [Anaerolineae bacterium]